MTRRSTSRSVRMPARNDPCITTTEPTFAFTILSAADAIELSGDAVTTRVMPLVTPPLPYGPILTRLLRPLQRGFLGRLVVQVARHDGELNPLLRIGSVDLDEALERRAG